MCVPAPPGVFLPVLQLVLRGARPLSLGGGRARLSAGTGALMGGRESPPPGEGMADAGRFPRMQALLAVGNAVSSALAVESDRTAASAARLVRRRELCSRPLVAMERSTARATIQSMTVEPNLSNAEAFAAAGLDPPDGEEITLVFTTIGRKKIIESVYVLYGDKPEQTEITVHAGLYLLEHVPDFANHETRSGIEVNASLAFQKTKHDEFTAAAAAAHEVDKDPALPSTEEAAESASDEEAALEAPEPVRRVRRPPALWSRRGDCARMPIPLGEEST